LEANRWITNVFPHVKVIDFTSSTENNAKERMFEAGASDFLLKDCGFGQITSAIKAVTRGMIYA